MAKTGRYCVDCGEKLVYYPNLSNPKAPNEFRILSYACPGCTKDFNKPKMITIERNVDDDPIDAIRVRIEEYKEKHEASLKKSQNNIPIPS